jgi:hypothetical protein
MITATTVIFPRDGDVEIDGDKPLVCDRPRNKRGTGSAETDNLQRADRANHIAGINGSH